MESHYMRPTGQQSNDFIECRRLISNGEARTAVEVLRATLATCPAGSRSALQALVQLGLASLAANELETTKSCFQDAIALNKSLPHWAYWLAGASNPRFIPMVQSNLAYCPIPKCGSTSLKEVIAEKLGLMDGRQPGTPNVHQIFGVPQSRKYWVSLDKVQGLHKFVVIRDPIERFMSFYQHNIVEARSLLKVSVRNELKGTKLSFRPTINEFISGIETYASIYLSVRHHITPQNTFIGTLSNFDSVYRLADISGLKTALLGNDGSGDMPHSRKSSKKTGSLLASLSPGSIRKLLDVYSLDYQVLASYFDKDAIISEYNSLLN